jgi:hypothetical protein
MASSTFDIQAYHFSEADGLLLDANIWLLLYGPGAPDQSRRVAIYSEAFVEILNAGSRINLEVLVLSEFINRCARFEYDLRRVDDPTIPTSFKAFRNTPAFAGIASSISVAAKKVVQHCRRVDSGFPELLVESVLDEYSGGRTDFNDQALAGLCKLKGYKLVTDDSDFISSDVTVITANVKLLRS